VINSSNPANDVELQSILDNLAARGLREYVKVDYHVIRGLAYYTGVVFEALMQKRRIPRHRAGGALRQPRQAHQRRRVDLPALGFGMGDVGAPGTAQGARPPAEIRHHHGRFCFNSKTNLRPQSETVQDLRAAG